MNTNITRRRFLGAAGIGSLSMGSLPLLGMTSSSTTPLTILFQGDSITDGNRGRSSDPNHILGHGYAFDIASRLGADYPERNLTLSIRELAEIQSRHSMADGSQTRWISNPM